MINDRFLISLLKYIKTIHDKNECAKIINGIQMFDLLNKKMDFYMKEITTIREKLAKHDKIMNSLLEKSALNKWKKDILFLKEMSNEINNFLTSFEIKIVEIKKAINKTHSEFSKKGFLSDNSISSLIKVFSS